MPSLSRVREESKRIKCLSNLRQLGNAFIMYSNNNKGGVPRATPRYNAHPTVPRDWIFPETQGAAKRDLSDSATVPYLGSKPINPEFFRCPSDEIEGRQNNDAAEPYKYSYSMNMQIHSVDPYRLPVTKIRNASTKMLLIEEDERFINDGWWAAGGNSDFLAIRHDFARKPESKQSGRNPANDDRRGNAAFCDGHAEYVPRRDSMNAFYYDPLKTQ